MQNKKIETEKTKENKAIVLQKYLSMCSVCSRRKSEEMIVSGRIKINEKIARLGDRVIPNIDKVFLDSKQVLFENKNHYYVMLNKPRGFVTTMQDERGRRCVADLVRDIPERVYPAGRLDKNSEGLLIMTNDGDFANSLIHPSKDIWKTYRVTVRPKITEEQLTSLCSGLEVDGKPTHPAVVKVLTQEKNRVVLEISIKEGRNRQIRKMCESVGLEVARLKRISIGGLKLGMLGVGKWRELSKDEINLFI